MQRETARVLWWVILLSYGQRCNSQACTTYERVETATPGAQSKWCFNTLAEVNAGYCRQITGYALNTVGSVIRAGSTYTDCTTSATVYEITYCSWSLCGTSTCPVGKYLAGSCTHGTSPRLSGTSFLDYVATVGCSVPYCAACTNAGANDIYIGTGTNTTNCPIACRQFTVTGPAAITYTGGTLSAVTGDPSSSYINFTSTGTFTVASETTARIWRRWRGM